MTAKASTNALAPSDKHRQDLLASLPEDAQQAALDLAHMTDERAKGLCLYAHNVGTRVDLFCKSKEREKDLLAIAEYTGIEKGADTLYRFNLIATRVARELIMAHANRSGAGGMRLNTSHLYLLASSVKAEEHPAYVDKILTNGWSASELRLELRAGSDGAQQHTRPGSGRKPGVPANPMQGLQKFRKLSRTFYTFHDVATKHVFAPLTRVAADKITQRVLVDLYGARRELASVVEASAAEAAELGEVIVRAERVLVARGEALPSPDVKDAAKLDKPKGGKGKGKGKGDKGPKVKAKGKPKAGKATQAHGSSNGNGKAPAMAEAGANMAPV